jgi:hypothetical protein
MAAAASGLALPADDLVAFSAQPLTSQSDNMTVESSLTVKLGFIVLTPLNFLPERECDLNMTCLQLILFHLTVTNLKAL